MTCATYRSGLASILLKKSPPIGYNELRILLRTMSVSTLKYWVYEEMLKNPFQLFVDWFVDCWASPSASIY